MKSIDNAITHLLDAQAAMSAALVQIRAERMQAPQLEDAILAVQDVAGILDEIGTAYRAAILARAGWRIIPPVGKDVASFIGGA